MQNPAKPHSTASIDAHLLRVLTTLVAERSVSRTAIRLNQSQPAISSALRRLREAFGDPLLVRERSGMVPTQRALELREHARLALEEIDRMVAGPAKFDPASSQKTFQVASPDYLAMSFLAAVVERMRREAPLARLVIHPLARDFDYERALAYGDLDIVIGNWPQPPEGLHLSVLLQDELVGLMGRKHAPAAGSLTFERYLASGHVVPMPYSMAQRGVVETFLAGQKLTRDSRVVVPYFEAAPYMLVNTDLIFTTARHFAEHFARVLPLAIVRLPLEFPPMRFYQLWHDRSQHDAAHVWLRSLLRGASEHLSKPKSVREV
ncbi:MAG: LysR family transcriptional regulator [Betaproteobacteria bacterium]